MNKKESILFSCLGIALLFFTFQAQSAVITYEFSGGVRSIEDPEGVLTGTGLTTSSPLTGTIEVDPDLFTWQSTTPTIIHSGDTTQTIGNVTVTFFDDDVFYAGDPITYSANLNWTRVVDNTPDSGAKDDLAFWSSDQYQAEFPLPPPPADIVYTHTADPVITWDTQQYSLSSITAVLQDSSATALNELALPTTLDPGAFPATGLTIESYDFFNRTEGYTINAYIDPDSLVVSTEPPPPDAVVYLDFDNGVSGSLLIVDMPMYGSIPVELFDPTGLRHPSANFDDSTRYAIQYSLERIYREAGVNVEFTQDSNDARLDGSHYTVEFGYDDSTGFGLAYDISTNAATTLFPDRFDLRKGGTIAVFGNGSDASWLAEVAAHELGHGFGLFHTDPDVSNPVVMDYDYEVGDNATFHDETTKILIADNPAIPVVPSVYHNAEYHLRRYVNGEDKNSLEAELTPGGYDTVGYSIATLELSWNDIIESLDGVYFGTGIHGGSSVGYLPSEESESVGYLISVGHLVVENSLELEIPDFVGVSIFAMSKGSDFIDLILGRKDLLKIGEDLTLHDFMTEDLAFYQFDRTLSQFVKFADIDIRLISSGFVSPDSPPPVPLVGTLPLTAIGLLFLGAPVRRSFSRSSVC